MTVNRTRVTFTGFEPFWMRVLSEGLSSARPEFACDWIVWPSTFVERLRFVGVMLRSDVVVRVGMPFEFQSETNRLWIEWLRNSRKRTGVNYWIGSDSLTALRREKSRGLSNADRAAISNLTHIADSDTVRDELCSLGVEATVAWLPPPNVPDEPILTPLPADFTVLSYIPDRSSDFYGGPAVVEMARRLPGVAFLVVGGDGGWLRERPTNLQFIGWQSEMRPVFERCSCLVRMVEHDSVSGMVVEALAYGRKVIYSRPLPNTLFVPFGDVDGLERRLAELACAYRGVATTFDVGAARWATSIANRDKAFALIAGIIAQAASK